MCALYFLTVLSWDFHRSVKNTRAYSNPARDSITIEQDAEDTSVVSVAPAAPRRPVTGALSLLARGH